MRAASGNVGRKRQNVYIRFHFLSFLRGVGDETIDLPVVLASGSSRALGLSTQ